MQKFFRILGTKGFVISFSVSLVTVLLIFLVVAVVFDAQREAEYENVFSGTVDITTTLQTPEPEPEPEEYEYCDLPDFPWLYSPLTGLRIHEDYATRRPIAVVINNIRQAHPQSGITSADIVYEVLAEGDVTRFVAIFQSYLPEKIGSVRSARDYFIDFAFNHDAIFVYHGSSPAGRSRIHSTGIANIEGGHDGTVFWRDRTFPDWHRNSGTRGLEHSSFTGGAGLLSTIEAREIRDYLNDDPAYGFQFGAPWVAPIGEAKHVHVPFSANYGRTFIFDGETNKYLVENRDGALQDAVTAEQAAVSNILIQFTNMHVIAGDYSGRRSVTTIGSGRGYLITGGAYFPVLWEKTAHASPTRWTFENGLPIMLTPGATWICVFSAGGTVEITASLPAFSEDTM